MQYDGKIKMQIVASSCRNLQEQFTKMMIDYEYFFYILTIQICLYKSDFQKTALDIIYLFVYLFSFQVS